MMGKTHISMGVATALLVGRPTNLGDGLVLVIGGAVGGIMCDIEVHSNPRVRDALYARFIVGGIVLLAILIDLWIGGPVSDRVRHHENALLGAGGALFVGTAVYSRLVSRHRGFSHSVLALVLFSAGLVLVLPALSFAFALGFGSHVALDLLNRKPVQLFYPSERGKFCLRLCYAQGVTNNVFLILGILGCAIGVALPFQNAAV